RRWRTRNLLSPLALSPLAAILLLPSTTLSFAAAADDEAALPQGAASDNTSDEGTAGAALTPPDSAGRQSEGAAQRKSGPPGEADSAPGARQAMAGMGDESAHHGAMDMRAGSFIEQVLDHDTSGTSAEPDSTPHPMLMTTRGRWRLMFHGVGFLSAIQQSGPRGRDKVFPTNWLMPMAQRDAG